MKSLNVIVILVTIIKPSSVWAMSYDYVYNNERHYQNYLPSATISTTTTNQKVPTSLNAVFGVFVNEDQNTNDADSAAIGVLPKRLVYCLLTYVVNWD